MLTIFPETRRRSGKAVGSQGSGKTFLAASLLYQDLRQGLGGIVFDPMRKLTEYLFQMIAFSGLPWLWDRIIYVPVGGMVIAPPMDAREAATLTQEQINALTWVVPTSFLYRRSPFDSLRDQTGRVTGMWERLMPEQRAAPIHGLPSIVQQTTYCGMLLAAMGKQLVPDASLMLRDPGRWDAEIARVVALHPDELAPAADTLREYADPRSVANRNKRNETLSFERLVEPYETNPRLRAQYGAGSWGVDLQQVDRGKLVIFDCAGLAPEERRTALTWLFTVCMEHFDKRGSRRDVITFTLDELSWLVNKENPILEEDLKQLIAVIGRNNGVSSFFTYQEVTQPPTLGLRLTMDMVGYSFYSGTSDPAAAQHLAKILDDFDPNWIKDTRTQVASTRPDLSGSYQEWIEEINLYYTAVEQELMHMTKHRERPGLTFAVAAAAHEGDPPRYRGTISIKKQIEQHRFVKSVVDEARRRLVKQHGRRVSDVLAEIAARQPPAPTPTVVRTNRQQHAPTTARPAESHAETPRRVAPPPLIG